MKVAVAPITKKTAQLIHIKPKALKDLLEIDGVTRILTR